MMASKLRCSSCGVEVWESSLKNALHAQREAWREVASPLGTRDPTKAMHFCSTQCLADWADLRLRRDRQREDQTA